MKLSSEIRTETGKGQARRLRSVGKIPAVFYGEAADPIMLSVDSSELEKMLKGKTAENIIFDLIIGSGKDKQSKKVMIKEMQKDPVERYYLHVDFYQIAMEKEIEANIPIVLINTPKGVTNGGILQHIRRELSILCLPKDLVEKIEIDVSDLDIGNTIHIGDVVFPHGLKPLEEDNITVATVVAPEIVTEEEEEEKEEEIEEAIGEDKGAEEES